VEWIWPVAFIVVLISPVIWLVRTRTPFRGLASKDASEAATRLEQLRSNNRFKP
jgi:hypothetical protein